MLLCKECGCTRGATAHIVSVKGRRSMLAQGGLPASNCVAHNPPQCDVAGHVDGAGVSAKWLWVRGNSLGQSLAIAGDHVNVATPLPRSTPLRIGLRHSRSEAFGTSLRVRAGCRTTDQPLSGLPQAIHISLLSVRAVTYVPSASWCSKMRSLAVSSKVGFVTSNASSPGLLLPTHRRLLPSGSSLHKLSSNSQRQHTWLVAANNQCAAERRRRGTSQAPFPSFTRLS